MLNAMYQGNCKDILKKLSDNTYTGILTDPPYGLSFMGKKWDYDVPDIETFKELLRVTKSGGYMLCFAGSRTQHRMAVNIEDAGWIIKDTIMWVYGTGFPKSHNLQDTFEGYGTALKPAYEPIIMAMKPCDGTYAENAINHGVAGLNIEECRVTEDRWPANLIHDGSDNVIELFPETGKSSGGRIGNAGGNAVQCVPTGQFKKGQSGKGDSGSAARFFYCAKASKTEKNAGIEIAAAKQRDMSRNADQASMNGGDGNPFNRGAKIVRNHHPTVKPIALMEYLAKLLKMPENTKLLDPFMGSGTTLIACQRLDIDCDGIEMDEDYFEIAQSRIRFYSGRELDYEIDKTQSKKEPTQLNIYDYLESM